MKKTEQDLRIELAAAYRLAVLLKMEDMIFNHISVRSPENPNHFLLNPFGMLFEEVTASNLLKIDLEGNTLEGEGRFNPAGYVLHSAVYKARPDVQCVVHFHSKAGVGVAALECGLLPLYQFGMQFHKRLAYHDYEGVALSTDEQGRIAQDLGRHRAMILRNHGLLTADVSIPQAFMRMYYLEEACRIQLSAQAANTSLNLPSEEVAEHTAQQFEGSESQVFDHAWAALLRKLDRKDPSYKSNFPEALSA